jgi:hypothetical protein
LDVFRAVYKVLVWTDQSFGSQQLRLAYLPLFGAIVLDPLTIANAEHSLNLHPASEASSHGAQVVQAFFHLVLG